MRVCSIPKCPALIESPGQCAKHKRAARAARTDNAVYGTTEHRDFRLLVLQRDRICAICRRARATVADHWPLSRRELVAEHLNPNDPKRGRGLCHGCHSKVTANTPGQEGGWNRRD